MTDHLPFAIRALKTGDVAGAEIAARLILDQAPDDAAASHLLGIIAARVQAFDQAEDYFARALAAEPGNAQISQNLAAARAARRPVFAPGPRYLVIREWGFGFWSDVSHVLGALLLAEATGRTPVTWWGPASLFSDGSDRDAFQNFFHSVSDVALEDLDGAFFPPRWNLANLKTEAEAKWKYRTGPVYFLNRPEQIAVCDFFAAVPNILPWLAPSHPLHGKSVDAAYRYLAKKYLRPRADIIAACDAFFERQLKDAPFVAAHLRGTDKFHEDDSLQDTNRQILSQLERTQPDQRVLILTDDTRCLEMAREKFGGRIAATDCRRSNGDKGVHLSGGDPVQTGCEAMIDAYLALRAERFIGNGLSNVSAMIAVIKDWNGNATLIGPSILDDRGFMLYQKKTG